MDVIVCDDIFVCEKARDLNDKERSIRQCLITKEGKINRHN